MRVCAMRPHDVRASLIRFSDVLGSRAGSARSTRQIVYSNGWRLRDCAEDSKLIRRGARSAEPADLLLGDDALDVLGLALDPVARPAVGFDRQAGDDGIDAPFLHHGAALRALELVMHVGIDRVIVGHRLSSLLEAGF